MSDDDRSLAAPPLAYGRHHDLSCQMVESAGRLIENKNWGITKSCSSDSNSLLLPTAHGATSCTDHCIQALWHITDCVAQGCRFKATFDLLLSHFAMLDATESNVFEDGLIEENALLLY